MRLAALLAILATLTVSAAEKVIVIDPGHGGSTDAGSQKERTLSSSNNATSPSKLLEKDLTLELSLEVAKQLSARPHTALKPVLTRTKDENPDFARRAAFCAAAKPVAIFSIHFNASDNHAALGTTAVVAAKATNPNYAADEAFAKELIQAAHGAVVKFVPRSTPLAVIPDSHLHGGAGSNFFYQLARHPELNNVPKCFLEIEFIDRKDVDTNLLAKRREAFPAIAKAIADYLATRFE
ncbi:N-acetylmuramoyl-L-alanine amidase [Luteolibacter ambystomatis]|uniref:N-acetylmuramoyl-L-alanine amidase n=1 Tax=Luteolibacter ambystomatis TaxID=2824561 RepID=A0A975PFX9_9BACT|nr:N-acetylmuramoyl-L-alanine amidase [Luteolibacter ambystomatis]QUE52298.1 N-acetylmuramoyl-L-alanine amidase [Luteolibacter ambystomatis]